ncbi:MAG: 3-methyl-2-oxobutanoate hydroxymethyltransferase, partial [Roseburia sp.]|nr:3-methyl-2-oxobutanoate hydroxymethyltransferase [Roseburia sp.]
VYQDLLSMYGDFKPKFVKVFANAGETMREGVKNYIRETKEGTFPAEEHCFKIDDTVIEKLY